MNPVKRCFADLMEPYARTGRFTSLQEQTDSITDYLVVRNKNLRPYRWKASGEDILAKIQKASRVRTESAPSLMLAETHLASR